MGLLISRLRKPIHNFLVTGVFIQRHTEIFLQTRQLIGIEIIVSLRSLFILQYVFDTIQLAQFAIIKHMPHTFDNIEHFFKRADTNGIIFVYIFVL